MEEECLRSFIVSVVAGSVGNSLNTLRKARMVDSIHVSRRRQYVITLEKNSVTLSQINSFVIHSSSCSAVHEPLNIL